MFREGVSLTDFLIRHFVKDYQNISDRAVRDRYGSLGCVVGILCNIFLFCMKLVIGLMSGSVAILADAFNNLSDMGSSLVVLLGFKLSCKPADPEHPFGHGRMEYMSGFIVSVIIILVGFELFKSSAEKIFHPDTLSLSLPIVLGLVLSVAVKLWMFFFNRSLGRRIDSSALRATATDSLSDCVATTAVILATVISALTSVNIDAWAGILVAGFILYNGIGTARDTMNPLLGTPPSPELVREIKEMVLSHKDFVGIHDLIVHNYGPGRIFASAHVEVPADIDIVRCHEEIDACEKEVGEALHLQMLIHMDPIATNDEEVNRVHTQLLQGVRGIDERLSIHDFRMVKGEQRSNLIFDLVLPVGYPKTRAEIGSAVDAVAKAIDPTYFCIITYDVDLE